MDIISIIDKLEYDYFSNMKSENLYHLSYYCYVNGDYYKSYLYSNKVNSKYASLVYNILSLLRLGYKNMAYIEFNSNLNNLIKLYNETNYFGLNSNMIKTHIVQIFIIFENNSLIKEIQNPLSDEEKIYYFLHKGENSFDLINSIANYEDYYIKNIILNNIKTRIHDNLQINNVHKDVNYLEKTNISLDYNFNNYYNFNYKDNNIEIISYNLENNMSSMHILKFENECIIIDCGSYIDDLGNIIEIDTDKFFKENQIYQSNIKGVFITHAHLDHYGSLDKLKNYEIFMTKETYELIDYINKVSNNRLINLEEYDITFIKYNKSYKIGNLNIVPIPNGHILGSCAYLVHIEKIRKKVLFTGDFCLNNQNLVRGMNINHCRDIDYLVTETTYGGKKFSFTYEDRLKLLIEVINTSLINNIPVFIPAFSIGRTQEIAYFIAMNFPYSKILIDGASIGCTKIYGKYYEKLANCSNIEFGANDLNILDKINLFDIIISSSGMLQNGSKSKTYLEFIKNSNQPHTVIKSGFIQNNIEAYEELKFFDGISFNFFDIGLSAHATYNQLLYLINLLKPQKIIMVHGEGIKI